ncbi:MAG: hypothetical protein ACK5ME_01335 [Parahaliea sp.]
MQASQTDKREPSMIELTEKYPDKHSSQRDAAESIDLVQRGNLKLLENTLHKQWRSGQNIVLCWSADERGVMVIWVPHYFLGNFSAQSRSDGVDNETFIGDLISGRRRKTREELFALAAKLDVAPSFVKLNTALSDETAVLNVVEQIIKRYGLSYVQSRGVLLFDIAGFSLYTPFEQASQLNSLSYSMNSAYNKLHAQGVEVNFARTTTGDGYYVWNRDENDSANQDLFMFMLLVIADNAVARGASKGNTVPLLRSAYHVGGHYELYQAEGVNPTVFSYIVGDVTIDLARMVDLAQPSQILVGDFSMGVRKLVDACVTEVSMEAPAFVRHCNDEIKMLDGIQLSGKKVKYLHCKLTGDNGSGEASARRFLVVDKHGLSRHTYNLQLDIKLEDESLELGIGENRLPGVGEKQATLTRPSVGQRRAGTTRRLVDEPASILRKRPPRSFLSED